MCNDFLDTGPAEKCSSQIEVFVDGPHFGMYINSTCRNTHLTHDHLMLSFLGVNLCAIPVEATVGVARLCVPRSMQVS